MVEGERARGPRPVIHALLLGLTIYVAAHDSATIYPNLPDPEWMGGWLAPALALANLLYWLSGPPAAPRLTVARSLAKILPIPAAAAGYMAYYGLFYTLATHASLISWAQMIWTCVCCFVVCSALAATGGSVRAAVWGIVSGGVAIGVEGVVRLFSRVQTPEQLMAVSGNRIAAGDPFLGNRLGNGSLPYPTLIVSLFLVFGSLALGLAVTSRTWPARLFAGATWLVNGMCAWLTASRGGMVLFVLMSLAHGAAALLWRSKNAGSVRAIAAISGIVALLVAGFVGKLVLTKGSILRADGSLSSRVKMWRVCWHVFRSNPLTGGGPGSFREGWRAFIRTFPYPEYSVPHSLYFGILCEGGLLLFAAAAALFIGLVVETWCLVRSNIDESDRRLVLAFALGLLAVLAHDLNENSFQMHPIYILTAVFGGILTGLGSTAQGPARL